MRLVIELDLLEKVHAVTAVINLPWRVAGRGLMYYCILGGPYFVMIGVES